MTTHILAKWPVAPGSYSIGSMKSPVSLAMIGRPIADIAPSRYCIKGSLRSANIGIEILIINLITNSRIRYLIVCGREEGHLPGDALLSLSKNGVDEKMRIIGTKAQLPYLPDISHEMVNRFREQVQVIDLIYPKETDGAIDWQDPSFQFDQSRIEELENTITECERNDPGPFDGERLHVDIPGFTEDRGDIGRMMHRQVDRISTVMLRMSGEALATEAHDVLISERFGIVADPVDGSVFQVPSLPIYLRMKGYLTGREL